MIFLSVNIFGNLQEPEVNGTNSDARDSIEILGKVTLNKNDQELRNKYELLRFDTRNL
jgi:hypothetical protein